MHQSVFQRLFLAVAATITLVSAHALAADGPAVSSDDNIHLRGLLSNSRIRFEKEQKGHVAFIGGSITEMNGYRPMVMADLQKRYPKTKFDFTNAGISSTCSTTGAFRLHDHVLGKGPVDLFFVEFAVNDDQDAAHAERECIRGLEGVIRHTRMHNPYADIVVTYFVNPGMLAQWQAGKTPLSAAAHDKVVKHYNVSTINLAKETADQITTGTMTWKQFGGTHPAPYGNRLCAMMIDRLLTKAAANPLPGNAIAHAMPDKPLDANSYYRGRLIDPAKAKIVKDMFVRVPNWKAIKGSKRSRFTNVPVLEATTTGAEATLAFDGTAVGAFVVAGPDAGSVETSVDGGPFKLTNLYHHFSRGLHYPRTVMFETDLKPGKHTLRIRVAANKNKQSGGTAIRILHFVAN